jgi:hypothetical protein
MPSFLDTFFPTRPAQERLELLAALYEPLGRELALAYEKLEDQAALERSLRAAADASFAIPGADMERIASIKMARVEARLMTRLAVRNVLMRRLCAALQEVQDWLAANVTPEGLEAWEARHGPLLSEEELMARLGVLLAEADQRDGSDAAPRSDLPRPIDRQGSESHRPGD